MRAAVLTAGSTVKIIDVPSSPPGPSDVVIQTLASGVCHTDLHVANGLLPTTPPLVLGHEGVGTVVEVGGSVVGIGPGDLIIAVTVGTCGSCYWCTAGQPNLCPVRWAPPRGRYGDEDLHCFAGLGTFAETMTIDQALAVRVESDLPPEQLALLGCGVMTGFGAVVNTAGVRPGESVAVIGCGGVGLSAVQGAVIAGASTIIAVDLVAAKREAALKLGATAVLDPEDGATTDAILELTAGRGVDAAIDVVGLPATTVDAWRATRRGGTTVVVGVGPPDGAVVLPSIELLMSEKRLTGCIFGSAHVKRDIPRLVALASSGRLDLASMISRRIHLTDVPTVLTHPSEGPEIRSVITAFAGAST